MSILTTGTKRDRMSDSQYKDLEKRVHQLELKHQGESEKRAKLLMAAREAVMTLLNIIDDLLKRARTITPRSERRKQ